MKRIGVYGWGIVAPKSPNIEAFADNLASSASWLDACGVCWGPYQTFGELVAADPRCQPQAGLFREVEQPGIGRFSAPVSPLAFQPAPSSDLAGVPQSGGDLSPAGAGARGVPQPDGGAAAARAALDAGYEAAGLNLLAPALGEHTDEVLADWLGLSPGEIGGLHDRGLVAGS